MPGGDGTGPAGMGPMTGRAAGFCAGYATPGFANPVGVGFAGRGLGRGRGRGGMGRGFGWGRGMGWGRGAWAGGVPAQGVPYAPPIAGPQAYGAPYGVPYTQPTPQQETDVLKGQAEYLEDALDGIRKRLAELEAAQAEKK